MKEEEVMGDRNRGLYDKFFVERTDGSSTPGEKHDGCEYFVLDITHDPHAGPALLAYAESARKDGYELLADDIIARCNVPDVNRDVTKDVAA